MTLNIDLTKKELRNIIMSIPSTISCEEAIDAILLFQTKNKVNGDL